MFSSIFQEYLFPRSMRCDSTNFMSGERTSDNREIGLLTESQLILEAQNISWQILLEWLVYYLGRVVEGIYFLCHELTSNSHSDNTDFTYWLLLFATTVWRGWHLRNHVRVSIMNSMREYFVPL